MKYFKVILLWVALLGALGLTAQDNHFIYIQAENKQPFQAQFDRQVLSASASGYLMVPQLPKGTHYFTIEFVNKQLPPQQLYCTVDNKDLGFLLKYFGEKGWGLLDLETSNIVMAEPAQQEKKLPTSTVPSDPFAELLALVVNDPTINQPDEEVKPVVIHQPKTIIAAEATQAPALLPSLVSIIKKESNLSNEGLEMNYEVKTDGVVERIQVLIPADIEVVANSAQEAKVDNAPPVEISVPQEKMAADTVKQISAVAEMESNKTIVVVDTAALVVEIDSAVAPAQIEAAAEKPVTKFLKMELPNPNEMVKNTDSPQVSTVAPLPMINSDCKKLAAEEDVEKLRKKMAGEESADDKIVIARKVFKTRCFTTEQIKALSAALVTDADRYNFFDAAYPFVSDAHYFPALQNQLLDSYYISRFKVMIRQ